MRVLMLLLGVFFGAIISILHCKFSNRLRKILILAVSLNLTFLGFVIAVADEYYSQYDYKLETIRKYERIKKSGVELQDLIGTESKTSPEYVFILDVSGSTKNSKVNSSESIDSQIQYINKQVPFYNLQQLEFKKVGDNWDFNKLLQIRLINSLMKIDVLDRDSVLKLSLIRFHGHSRCQTLELKDKYSENMKNMIISVNNENFNGSNTDFVKLLEVIRDYIKGRIEQSVSSNYVPKDFVFVFLTDYLHDPDEKINKYDTQKQLASLIREIDGFNVQINLFVVENNDGEVFVQEPQHLVSVYKLFKNSLSFSTHQTLDLRSRENEICYQMILPNPIPFFYTNSLFEKDLKTVLFFNDKSIKKADTKLLFGLNSYFDSSRQEYLIKFKKNKVKRLSKNLIEEIINANESVELSFTGYIPPSYTSPDIVIEDSKKGVRYIIPAVFYKNFPQSGKWLLLFILGMDIAIFSALAFFKNKQGSNRNDEKKRKGTGFGLVITKE